MTNRWLSSWSERTQEQTTNKWIRILLLLSIFLLALFNERGACLASKMRDRLDQAVAEEEALDQRAATQIWRQVGTEVPDVRWGRLSGREVLKWRPAAAETRGLDTEEWLYWIGEEGRLLYAGSQWTLDLLFPLVYGALLFLLMARFGSRRCARAVRVRWTFWVLGLAVAFDLSENLLTTVLALTFQEAGTGPAALYWLAHLATSLKLGALLLVGSFFVAAVPCGRLLRFLRLVFLCRAPLLLLGVLILVGRLAASGSATFQNLFKELDFVGVVLVSTISPLAALLGAHGLLLILRRSPDRFGVRRLRLSAKKSSWPLWPLVAGIVAVVAAPLIWRAVLGSKETALHAAFASLLGIGIAVAIAGGVFLLCERLPTAPNRVVRWAQRRLNPGYVDPKTGLAFRGHGLAISLLIALLILYIILAVFTRPDGWLPPAIVSALLLVMMVSSGLGALTFFLDKYRIPVLLPVAVWLAFLAIFLPGEHRFPVFPPKEEPAPLQEAFLNRLGRSERQGPPVVTVAVVSGGGIQASGWSTRVLTGLAWDLDAQQRDREAVVGPVGRGFLDSIHLISSASGGSTGTLFFLEGLSASGSTLSKEDLTTIHEASVESSLEGTAWGWVYPDFQRIVFPFLVDKCDDRGWAMERTWQRTIHEKLSSGPEPTEPLASVDCKYDSIDEFEEKLASSGRSPTRLSDWYRPTRNGTMPAVLFNATFVDDGQQAVFGTLDLSPLQKSEDVRAICWPARGDEGRRVPVTDPDLSLHYPDTELDLFASTAARLSATFPWISPVSKAHLPESPEELEGCLGWHLADGGYFDNFGVVAGVKWIRQVRGLLEREAGASDERPTVLVLRISAFPAEVQSPPAGSRDVAYAWLGPLQTVLNVRTSSQNDRNALELDLLRDELEPESRLISLTFRPQPRVGRGPPLSWHLSHQDKRELERSWKHEEIRDRVACLRGLFQAGGWGEACEDLEDPPRMPPPRPDAESVL